MTYDGRVHREIIDTEDWSRRLRDNLPPLTAIERHNVARLIEVARSRRPDPPERRDG